MEHWILLAALFAAGAAAAAPAHPPVGKPFLVKIHSSFDGALQSALVQVPEGYDPSKPAPLLVGLHTWSGTYRQQAKAMGPRANARGWLLVLPDFRGPNLPRNPRARLACASLAAQRGVMDAVRYMCERYRVDKRRIYLLGASGGGHMAQMMASKYPDVWAAVSAWVGISDLRLWQAENPHYAAGVHACMGGAPRDSAAVDWQYLTRSPITFIQNASNTWLDLQAGRRDRSVPYHHTVDAFERVSKVPGCRARLTVFEGGHEIHYDDAFAWLARHVKPAKPPRVLWLTTDEEKDFFFVHLAPRRARKLARVKIEIGEGPTLRFEAADVKEARIDARAAGWRPGQTLRVEFKIDAGPCRLLIGERVIDLAGETAGSRSLKL